MLLGFSQWTSCLRFSTLSLVTFAIELPSLLCPLHKSICSSILAGVPAPCPLTPLLQCSIRTLALPLICLDTTPAGQLSPTRLAQRVSFRVFLWYVFHRFAHSDHFSPFRYLTDSRFFGLLLMNRVGLQFFTMISAREKKLLLGCLITVWCCLWAFSTVNKNCLKLTISLFVKKKMGKKKNNKYLKLTILSQHPRI